MRTDVDQLVAELPRIGIAQAGRLGLDLVPQIDQEAWRHLVAHIARLTRTTTGARQTLTAWLGDALAYAEISYRGRIVTCATEAGLEPGTLRNAKLVCSRIPVSCRHDALSWTHHCEVGLAFADPAEIERWLDLAESEKLSTAELRRRIRTHLSGRDRRSPGPVAEGSVEIFELLRELRAISRFLEHRRSTWQKWPPGAARLALQELRPLADFVDGVRTRAVAGAAMPPEDLQAN